ncbi:MAG: response regulator [Kiritimatiellaeota bacterium]|nr:response regulator [Kiritimatiellota bacterium]
MNTVTVQNHVVLVIDDEVQIRRLLRITLEANGYKVIEAASGKDGLVEAATRRPDIVILDLGLPDMDGVAVLKRLREWSRVPVVVLSVRDRDEDKIAALDTGADDYVTKPFSTPELLVRLRVALRHVQPVEEEVVFRSGDLVVDMADRRVSVKGQEVKLTVTEYSLLRLLVRHAGRILTHRQILKDVWGPNATNQTHYLRVYVARLREKIEPVPSRPTLLITEPGIGYRLLTAE